MPAASAETKADAVDAAQALKQFSLGLLRWREQNSLGPVPLCDFAHVLHHHIKCPVDSPFTKAGLQDFAQVFISETST